ncbi:PREDICTED: calmodulin-binding transcription activator 3-like isoform X2 [Lupinus angustifolius]|uniref:calmodulin-binding transcription activator 3-like isoform X2 n=1 Tax=Lupinus angustifolius TaxID=3871 RepID=UPI00092FA516|nr:PREDICTED: calmodulin-binding transcription activator 3-like isoform X2 [Lupinus angustifolius]
MIMAHTKKLIPNQHLELDEILREAERRWFRPAEICEILRNYQKFKLSSNPPIRPPAGSLFLFDRKALRYFRKDGHRWRKKKDGKAVREAHEKLKVCCSFYLLQLEHIVLVHYREIKEGYKSGISHLPVVPETLAGSSRSSSAPSDVKTNSPISVVQTSFTSSAYRVGQNGRISEYEDADSESGPRASSHAQFTSNSIAHTAPLLANEAIGFSELSGNPLIHLPSLQSFYPGTGLSPWPSAQNSSRNTINMHDRELLLERSTEGTEDKRFDSDDGIVFSDSLVSDIYIQPVAEMSQNVNQVQKERDLDSFHAHSNHTVVATTTTLIEQKLQDGCTRTDNDEPQHVEYLELKQLGSFGRWMDNDIGGDCNNSFTASDSANCWNMLEAHNEDKEVSSLHQMQLDMDSLGPSLSQEQLFSIHDFSPDWAYAGVRTKVLIVGTFLGSKKLSNEIKWGCMFGEIEVSAEVLSENVIRCYTPLHSPGRVPFYVTCSNRLACSEVREFKYCENPTNFVGPVGIKITPEEELQFQMRLLKLIDLGPDKKWLKCSVVECEGCKLKGALYSIRDDSGVSQESFQIDGGDHMNPRDVLFQRLTRDKLYEWLVFKVHEGGKGPHVLDNEGLGVIHLASALGYVWAMSSLVAAGISPNFRDAQGRTGLHWASCFGREETAIALLKLGATPSAVEDPTSAFPQGQTAADLASSRGHKGIAGYLAEADLTSQLSTLTVNENVIDNVATTVAADSDFESTGADSSYMTMDEQHHLKESLAAFRKSALAAASIQAAFRARSFRQRQLSKSSNDTSEAAFDLVADASDKVQKMAHFEDYLHSAALSIQKRYRGWKRRKDFLKIRNRIVKIQAHIRGHQVRKQYKKVVWSVSIVEKVILRWRRKGAGLRGFRVEQPVGVVAKDAEYEFLSIGRRQKSDNVNKALDRVKSMVRNPEARDQYMRLVMKYQNLKIGEDGSSESQHVD